MKLAFCFAAFACLALAQPPDFGPPGFGPPPGFAPPGFGPPGGPGGRGGFGMGQRTKVLEQFDKDKDGFLDAAERKAAREYLATRPRGGGRGGRGFFGGGGRGGAEAGPVTPGPRLK